MGFNPFLVRASVYCETRRTKDLYSLVMAFQSLLSQGISLLEFHLSDGQMGFVKGFNPFLVRASVYCASWADRSKGESLWSFNPFLVRASVYCRNRGSARSVDKRAGQFQSLLSQGISLLTRPTGTRSPTPSRSFNPFLVRASVYWVNEITGEEEEGNGFNPFLVRASVY